MPTTKASPATATGVPPVVSAVASGVADPMLIVASDGRIMFANEAAERLFGAPLAGLRGRHLETFVRGLNDIIAEACTRRFVQAIDSDDPHWGGPPPAIVRSEHLGLPCAVRVSTVVVDATRFACVSIRTGGGSGSAAAPQDQPDGRSKVERALEQSEPAPARGLVVIDLDHFELINEGMGRAVGDQLLRRVAELLAGQTAAGELGCRLEADRFALVVTAPSADAHERGRRLLDTIRRARFEVGDRVVRVTASAGVSTYTEAPRSGEQALLDTEAALRAAKEAGRDRIAEPSDELRRASIEVVDWADQIRTGIESGALHPHFQPILELDSDRIAHYELLARMHGPGGQLIPPGTFIPIAERLGMIGVIDRWALRTAILTLARWDKPADVRIAVNVSGRSVGDEDLLSELRKQLVMHSVDPERLIVEVTETAAIASIEAAQEFGDELRDLGIGFALDDFGAGFGTFYYLKHLPLTEVKIDGEFIRGIARSASDQLLVKALVEIARSLGIKTVAEFVADGETLDCVRRLGLDYAQGFHIGKPAPIALAAPPEVVASGPASAAPAPRGAR